MRRPLAWLFAALALTTGLALIAVTPIGQVADEPNHIARADSLLHGELIGHPVSMRFFDTDQPVSSVAADTGLVAMAADTLREGHRQRTAALEAGLRAMPWTGQAGIVSVGPLAAYMPALYVPSAAMLGLGHWLGASPYAAVQAGRLVNLLLFVAAGFAALRLAGRGRAVMLCVLSVPMTLSLAASFNQDGLLIAAATLAAALAGRPGRGFWIAAVLIAVIGMAKPPYLALAALLLLPLPEGWWQSAAFWRRAGVAVLTCLPGLLWLGLAVPLANGVIPREAYEAGPLWPGPRPALFHGTDVAAQIHVLLAHPLAFIWLPTVSFWGNINLVHESIGVLGWLNVIFAQPFYTAWLAVAAVAVAGDALRPGTGPRWVESLLLVVAVLAGLWAVYLSQYLAWTNVGDAVIVGPTGRYILPLLPMLALAIPRIRGAGLLGRVLSAVPVLALAAGLYIVPRALIAAFYLG